MSPEQAKGRPADKRSDIWAFGWVFYEMLTGRRAFEGDDISEILAGVLTSAPNWTLVPASVAPPVDIVLHGCFEKDPRSRVGDMAVIRFVLQAGPALISARTSRQRRVSLWVVGLSVASALILGGLAVREMRPTDKRTAG